MAEVIRAIRESEYEECIDLWKKIWPEDERSYFERYFFGDHDFQPEYCRVCEVDGRLVSAVHIVKRVVSCGDFTLTMGGIANVVTLPEYRNRGYSTKCLQQATQVMEADAMDFSLLFSGAHELYESVGWSHVGGEEYNLELNGEFTPDRSSGLVYRAYSAEDDDAIHEIYNSFNHTRPITVRRSGPYWRNWLGWSGGRSPSQVTVAESAGKVSGYIAYNVDAAIGVMSILEFGVDAGFGDTLNGLVEYVALLAQEQKLARLRVPLVKSKMLKETVDRLSKSMTCERPEHVMVKVLDRDNLLHGLAPELTTRWIGAGSPNGELTFAGPSGATRIASKSGFLRIEAVDAEDSSLPESDMFNLVTGRANLVTGVDATSKQFASALFPEQDSWFWELDGF